MRLRKCTTLVVFFNIFLVLVLWKYFLVYPKQSSLKELFISNTVKPRDRKQEANNYLVRTLTIIIRDFFPLDNDLKNSINHLLKLIPNVEIIIICETLFPYPPMNIFTKSLITNHTAPITNLVFEKNVRYFHLDVDMTRPNSHQNPLEHIATSHVLLLPDGFRISNRQLLIRLVRTLEHASTVNSSKKILAVPFASNNQKLNYCFQVNTDFPNWTIEYVVKNSTRNCHLVKFKSVFVLSSFVNSFSDFQITQKHAMLMRTRHLKELSEPFGEPYPESFFLQAKFLNFEVRSIFIVEFLEKSNFFVDQSFKRNDNRR
jgi:hypothetical protein